MGGPYDIIDDGCLLYADATNEILQVDTYSRLKSEISGDCKDLGDAVLLPGLVMAHTHLELSHTRGRTQQGAGFAAWVRSLLQTPLDQCDLGALEEAVAELKDSGVCFVADISSRNGAQVASQLTQAGMDYLIFLEIFGFGSFPQTGAPPWPYGSGGTILETEPERVSAAGHALYSTSAARLQAAKSWCESRGLPFSLHLAETPEESELLLENKGDLADLFKKRVFPKNYQPPRLLPVAYADSLGLLNERTLAVHCVRVSEADVRLLAARRTHVCLCPRSNAYIGVGRPPVALFRKHGCSICLSTDGLSSCPDLDLWNELRYTRETLCPDVPLQQMLCWLTSNPARALGVSGRYGSLMPGKQACWTSLPEDLAGQL